MFWPPLAEFQPVPVPVIARGGQFVPVPVPDWGFQPRRGPVPDKSPTEQEEGGGARAAVDDDARDEPAPGSQRGGWDFPVRGP